MVSITLTTEQMRAARESMANNTPTSITLTTDQVNGLISDSLPTTPAFIASLGAAMVRNINAIADHITPDTFTLSNADLAAITNRVVLSSSMLDAIGSRVVC